MRRYKIGWAGKPNSNDMAQTSRFTLHAVRRLAFTLAEILIVLGLIGIVAESTIPTLITNVMSKVFTQSSTLTVMKITEATNQMKVDGVLDGYATNDAFVDAFKKYMKVSKTCDSTNLVKCFPARFKTGAGEDIDTTTLTTGTKLGANNIAGNTIGMMLANGTSIIFTLRDSTKVSGACERIDPFDNTKDTTGCMSLLYDTNGMGSPNAIGKDIQTINATISTCITAGGLCVDTKDITSYNAINTCSDTTYDSHLAANTNCANNRWAGAKKACLDKGMKLPTKEELHIVYLNKAAIGGFTASDYATASEYDNSNSYTQAFGFDFLGWGGKSNNLPVRCIK